MWCVLTSLVCNGSAKQLAQTATQNEAVAKQALSELQLKIDQSSAKQSEVEARANDAEKAVIALQSQLEIANKKAGHLASEIAAQKQLTGQSSANQKDYEDEQIQRIRELEEELQQLKSTAVTTVESEVDVAEQALAAAEKMFTAELEQCKQNAVDARKHETEAKEHLRDAEVKLQTANLQIAEQSSMIEALKIKIGAPEDEELNIKTAQQYQEEIDSLREQLDGEKSDGSAKAEEIEQIKCVLNDKDAALTSAQSELESANAQIRKLQVQLDSDGPRHLQQITPARTEQPKAEAADDIVAMNGSQSPMLDRPTRNNLASDIRDLQELLAEGSLTAQEFSRVRITCAAIKRLHLTDIVRVGKITCAQWK